MIKTGVQLEWVFDRCCGGAWSRCSTWFRYWFRGLCWTDLGALYVVVQVVPEGVDEVDGVVSGIGIGVTWEQDWKHRNRTNRSVSYKLNMHRSTVATQGFHPVLYRYWPKVMYPMLSPTAASVSFSSSGGSLWLNSTWGAVWLARRPSLNSYGQNKQRTGRDLEFLFFNL